MPEEGRIQKLEEGQAFTERAMEELSGEVRDLGKRVVELAAMLAQLEARLAAESDTDDDSDEK